MAAGDLNYPSSVLNDPSRNSCQAILIGEFTSFMAVGDLYYPSSVLNDPSRNPCQAILIALPSTSLSRNLAASGT